MKEIATRAKSQAPPAWVVWEALSNRDEEWLSLAEDEVRPTVVEADRPRTLVWSSLWQTRPKDLIRFELSDHGAGCLLRWRLLTPDSPPTDDDVRRLRHRLNYLINGELRRTFDN